MRRDIEFNADGVTLRGWFYKPKKGKGPFPCVVMAHGFSGTKEMSLDKFAEAFVAGGLSVLVYDNRCLGASDGEPRSTPRMPKRKPNRFARCSASSGIYRSKFKR